MQRCVACNRTYSDDTLTFCPDDGAQLLAVSSQPISVAFPISNAANDNQPDRFQPMRLSTVGQSTHINPMQRWVQISWILLGISALLLLVALITGLMNHGAPRSARGANPLLLTTILTGIFGGVFLLIGVIFFFVYRKQARDIDEILKEARDGKHIGGNLLAYWTYTPQEWSQFVETEVSREKKSQRTMAYIMLAVVLIIFATTFPSAIKHGASSFVPILLSLIFVGAIGVFAWWAAGAESRSLQAHHTGEAFIAIKGLLLNDRYYPWNIFGTRLTGVFYERGMPNVIRFEYRQQTGQGGSQTKNVRVPVPVGREVEAENLAARFPR